jgi:hypothetical protein
MSVGRFHPGKFALFAILSTADLSLTIFLLNHSRGLVYEGNPIANAWLSCYGWSGLIIYKVLTISLLAGSLLWVSLYQTRLAGRVLLFACVTLTLVVVYSANMVRNLDVADEERQLRTEDELAVYRSLLHQFAQASREVRSGSCTLAQATDRLAAAENSYWQVLLHRRYPGLTDRECLAAFLQENIQNASPNTVRATRVSRRRTHRTLES